MRLLTGQFRATLGVRQERDGEASLVTAEPCQSKESAGPVPTLAPFLPCQVSQ